MNRETSIKPMTMVELLPGLKGILSEDKIRALTVKKKPRPTASQGTLTGEKALKPMTFAEMRADLKVLKPPTARHHAQTETSKKQKRWNSSVKVDKTKSCTSEGQLTNNPVRKVLNFRQRPQISKPHICLESETPKFPKPETRAKKSIHMAAPNIIRISGICQIPETPNTLTKSISSRLALSNKENISDTAAVIPSKPKLPKSLNKRTIQLSPVLDTPLSSILYKSNCDDSFLEKEKEINEYEQKQKVINEIISDNNVVASTPSKNHRNVNEFFNNSNNFDDSSAYQDNTIMCFDKPSNISRNNKNESSILSLCNHFSKATLSVDTSDELDYLLKVEKISEDNIKILDKEMKILKDFKESQIKTLQYVRTVINEKKKASVKVNGTVRDSENMAVMVKNEKLSPEKRPIVTSKPCSVIKSTPKSPTYKIPKKNLCLRKSVICKSMPNKLNEMRTPNKGNQANSMYMEMKKHWTYLNTPNRRHNTSKPDTPAKTSEKLQLQLNKLFDGV